MPTDTADHLATMDRAARESNCGVPWQLLASIARVESDFGRNMSTSTAGAIGYGQFLPSSWAAFGSDGNAYDYRDALPAIALYLCQAGLERDPRTALFAYNHAEWYVDLVLDLAVRYDRMAPGAPTPDVLEVGPAAQAAAQMHYAAGRDLRLQTRSRQAEGGVRWVGVPWRGRRPGQPIAAAALQTTTLSMVRAAMGLRDDASAITAPATSEDLGALTQAAWNNGLLALPGQGARWTVSELRQHLLLGQPVVILAGRHGLPGHPTDEDAGEQPLVLIGTTTDGFIYSDPTFASSLGYGLELSEADLTRAWDAAARPRQALAFVARPKPLPRQAHLAEAQAPEPVPRVLPTPTPIPTATDIPRPTAVVAAVPTEAPAVTPTPLPVPPPAQPAVAQSTTEAGALAGSGLALALATALVLRRRLGRRPAE